MTNREVPLFVSVRLNCALVYTISKLLLHECTCFRPVYNRHPQCKTREPLSSSIPGAFPRNRRLQGK